jgi:DNA-binding winged helix-turn-helix (wHTH) protein
MGNIPQAIPGNRSAKTGQGTGKLFRNLKKKGIRFQAGIQWPPKHQPNQAQEWPQAPQLFRSEPVRVH